MIFAILIAVAIPLVFLYVVRTLDLYASGGMRTVLLSLVWGGVGAFSGAFLINNALVGNGVVGISDLQRFVAPVIEEILKSLILIYLVRRPQFTYFVDGAIYGFASGTAFAVFENMLYLSGAGSQMALGIAISRAFSTSLMHGSASALVGIALGRLRFGRGASRLLSVLLGWAAAMTLHLTYNNVVTFEGGEGLLIVLIAVGIGLGGVGLNAAFIFWGLGEERRWLHDTLKLDVGVSHQESSVIQKMEDLETLLKPITARFGEAKRNKVEEFLKLQAQLGLKRKVQQMTPDENLSAEMGKEVAEMREKMDAIRSEIGVYCMSYVRLIMPPETSVMWSKLSQHLVTSAAPTAGKSLWGVVETKVEAREEDAES